MAKVPRKFFGKDFTYKLKVHMQEISAVQEYVDVNMDDGSYKRADISRLLIFIAFIPHFSTVR